ncbi:nuclear factor of activated T-cells, cytoplasmic 1-like isoform X1 [Xyrauchen texanus]|uniref:nuclear factor of activated T-cells, cytoplasmic 1-like isoform X1 n=1 Tax=Xyrauchen texanus TaxID=154827 RepID=UPI002241DCF7|nr:nuclear factor of activated T-cells, cytoplasmic 1-like isoform X1 [Xyrauchen texanus]
MQSSAAEDAFPCSSIMSLSLPLPVENPCLATQYHSLQLSPVSAVGQREEAVASDYYLSHVVQSNGVFPLDSPRIEITSYGHYPKEEVGWTSATDPTAKQINIVTTLTLPSADAYRDPNYLSPASSLSSRSCNSDTSYESGFYNYDNSPQNSPWQSPCVSPKGSFSVSSCPHAAAFIASPRHSPSEDGWTGPLFGSRSNSPSCSVGGQSKRRYSFSSGLPGPMSYSPSQSPVSSPQGSPQPIMSEDKWISNTNRYTNSAIVDAINALSTDGSGDLDNGVPLKSRRTCLEQNPTLSLKAESVEENTGHDVYRNSTHWSFKQESYCSDYLGVPQHPYTWIKAKSCVNLPALPLDWQLPSHSGAYTLQIEVQPKSHHRAHYETEGSRGAVKAHSSGHPVVQLYGYMETEPLTLQLFIGTADDRLLRPHAFYQVHRITGKTVSTASHEVLQSNTKMLEIPLLPENNMRAIIDCAGILKLRNSDIELRKGETDIGRKNTCVRMVFRVHISQPNGSTVSLQTASSPIECSQRSAQELPLLEKHSLDCCPSSGGRTILLRGHNFLPVSKVMFVEKAQDGHHLWETEAKVDKDSFTSTSLVVEVPPYRHQQISGPVQVSFYVCNGKRKRSQYQCFTYLPCGAAVVKSEPFDNSELVRKSVGSGLSYCLKQRRTDAGVEGEHGPSIHQSTRSSTELHDLSPASFTKCLNNLTDHSLKHSMNSLPNTSTHAARSNSPKHACYSTLQPQGSSDVSDPGDPPLYRRCSPYRPTAGTAQNQCSSDSPPALISIKRESQELDQMYLDDVNEIIRNDLSSISAPSHT